MAAPDSIKKLVEEFERLKGGPPPDSFDEAQLGTSYLEPFWEALGWAVRDPREVVKEKRVHLRASTKHADYCFQLARKPQFIVEAKFPKYTHQGGTSKESHQNGEHSEAWVHDL